MYFDTKTVAHARGTCRYSKFRVAKRLNPAFRRQHRPTCLPLLWHLPRLFMLTCFGACPGAASSGIVSGVDEWGLVTS